MSANPIDENATPKTTGSLEELFRHHLGAEAAVPPRPLLWDQLDNALLLRQNEMYRRRLAATRWVAAASLLLATLAGTGWWSRRDAHPAGTEIAATPPSETGANARAAAGEGVGQGGRAAAGRGVATRMGAASPVAGNAEASASASPAARALAGRRLVAAAPPALAANSAGRRPEANFTASSIGGPARGTAGLGSKTMAAQPTDGYAATVAAVASAHPSVPLPEAPALASAARSAAADGAASRTPNRSTAGEVAVAGIGAVAVRSSSATLAAHPAALGLTGPAALPGSLTALALPAEAPPVPVAPRWRYGASYAAGSFNPNINFSRAGIDAAHAYAAGPQFGATSAARTEMAAAEYRDNLRPGLSQRLAVLATRHLKGHWLLSTGVELGQATARSTSTSAFVGEQLFEQYQPAAEPRRATEFRYRLASLPVELRYADPAKKGWSLYGRLGGAVSALLGVRSEVDGIPEATRTYSLFSAGTPYRRVLGSLRGGAGARFRPGSAAWALTLGPVAEVGLLSLNAHPAQGFLTQSRPYSFGVEAGLEFGR